jgi:hypothetical protein
MSRARRRARRPPGEGHGPFRPLAVVEVELSQPIPAIPARDDDGARRGAARLVVRLHTRTVGLVDVTLGEDGLSAEECARAVWAELGPDVDAHLRADGLASVAALDAAGLAPLDDPPCGRRRAAVLRAAPSASVVICTRERAGLLARTLASLRDLEYPDYEVLVVDGSAGPETADLVRDRFPEVRYAGVGAYGRSVALNRGIAASRGAIVAFTDDDVRVDRHWLAELAAALAEPGVACATGVAFPLELSTRAQLWFEESGGFTEGFARRTVGLDAPREPGSLLPFATGKIGAGVSMAWRREALEEIGGFDVALDTLTPLWPPRARPGSSGEDLSAFFDALVRGHRIVFEPSAIVYHEHRRTYEELARQIYWHGIGLSGHLTRCLLREPRRIPAFLWSVPRGLAYGFAGSSARNHGKSAGFPPALTRIEWRGVAEGPFAYLRGLPRARRIRAALAAPEGR